MPSVLEAFHPLIQRWFLEHVGAPTAVQEDVWRWIVAGEHVLGSAPTGSGKTMAAFLWSLNQLITGAWGCDGTRVLYVSPLKALNNDIQRNLLGPLNELESIFSSAGASFPEIRVLTRSGDTPSVERQRMIRNPPQVLITTPESLNLMLSSPRARGMLEGLETVVLDEIHAVAGSKRGTHLITAVDRLVPLSGEFQRVALSATVRPLEGVARFVGGYRLSYAGGEARYEPRTIRIVAGAGTKRYALTIRNVLEEPEGREGLSAWPAVAEACREIIERNRSTLIFVNSRRVCERVANLINQGAGRLIAYSHHGSLSREVRAIVEQRLKQGELPAIVATNSLELGIDIGALDEAVLVQAPFSVAAAVQRLGRAGHQVGAVSRGTLLPIFGRDFVDSAVVARSAIEGDIEPTTPVASPLDVLAQVIVSMTGVEPWNSDRLFDQLRSSAPYHGLARSQYDRVVQMLAGRYAGSRLAPIKPLLSVDSLEGTLRARRGALRALYSSGGTIPDRGYFTLRRHDTRAKIGELDEEFVWERRVGHTFAFGTQTWRVVQITHDDLLASPTSPSAADAPFWKAEDRYRPFHAAEKVALFLEDMDARLDDENLVERLGVDYFMAPAAAEFMVAFLKRQRTATRAALPHRHHLLVEMLKDPAHAGEGYQVIFHTLWGGAINAPFALALAQAFEDRFDVRLDAFSNNECVVLIAQQEIDPMEALGWVSQENIERLLRQRLEKSGVFGARFRENAARALLLPRTAPGRRMPLWVSRRRAQRLLESVMRYDDFPILAETWRTCLEDEFEMDALGHLLDELRSGVIRVQVVRTFKASPFAESILWRETNKFMYMDDTPEGGGVSSLSDDALKEVLFDATLRPRLDHALVARFQEKAHRTFPGYSPSDSIELLEWVKERLLIPSREWEALLDAIARDSRASAAILIAPIAAKLCRTRWGVSFGGVAAVENIRRLESVFSAERGRLNFRPLDEGPGSIEPIPPRTSEVAGREPSETGDIIAEFLSEWLRFYGPIPVSFLRDALPLDPADGQAVLDTLVETGDIVIDHLTEAAQESEVCNSENLELLLRLMRLERRAKFETLEADQLPLFLALHQGLHAAREADPSGDVAPMQRALEPLIAYPMDASALERNLLPARLGRHFPHALDALLEESSMLWFGTGDKEISFCFEEQWDTFGPTQRTAPELESELDAVFPARVGRYSFSDLLMRSGWSSKKLADWLWRMVWAGLVSNDSFATLRKGVETKFRAVESPVPDTASRRGRTLRRGFQKWKSSRPFPGNWFILPISEPAVDELEELERNRERARLVLDRYGVVFRELLLQERESFRWSALFPTLRLMELGGEIVAGSFFKGIPGLQFASHAAFRAMQRGLDPDAVFWICATDPASLCGIAVEGLKETLPKRIATNHLVYHGGDVVVESRRNGKSLEIHAPPDHPRLHDYLRLLHALQSRPIQPVNPVMVEKINGAPATTSPYVAALREEFVVSLEVKSVSLWRR